MQNHKSKNVSPVILIAGIAGIILALGGGVAWWAKYSLERGDRTSITNNPPITTKEPPLVPSNPSLEEQKEQVTICWLNPTNNQIELVSTTVIFSKSVEPESILKEAFEQLLAGPSQSADYTTTIPDGTKVLDIKTTAEGVIINLSQEFTRGGGSAAMTGRLAQVLYTATSLDANGKVWISVEGQPLTNLGGEGVIVSQPMTRQEFEANFSL
ncbi:MAG: GerMN domain-containing protein [Xenococcaceae cyanobacterium MO_167.B27]|nr:GerMN domain-containing protein [Xenococcaceae cyanobacterium MO_167.B27]